MAQGEASRHALRSPIGHRELAALESRIGPLAADYRDFLATVAELGAGPGYGLWDHLRCATASVLSNVLTELERSGVAADALHAEVAKRLEGGHLTTTSDGGDYFASGTPVNHCEGCVSLVGCFSCLPSTSATSSAR